MTRQYDATSVSTWSVDEVSQFLSELHLGALVHAFRENAVEGSDLLQLSDRDLADELGAKPLQIRKIRAAIAVATLEAQPIESGQPSHSLSTEIPVPASTPSTTSSSANSAHDKPLGDDESNERYPAPPPITEAVPQTTAPSHQFERTRCQARAHADAASRRTDTHKAASADEAVPVAPELVERYVDVLSDIQSLETAQVTEELPKKQALLKAMERQLQIEEQVLAKTGKALKKSSKEVEKVTEGWYFGKILGGKHKHRDRVKAATDKHATHQAKQKTTAISIRELQLAIPEMRTTVGDLQAQVARLRHAHEEEYALLEIVFRGIGADSPGDAHENTLEQEADALNARRADTLRYHSAFSQARVALKSAIKKLEQAIANLQRAFGLSSFDIIQNLWSPPFANSPSGLAADIMKRRACEAANMLTHAAQQDVRQARSLVPDIPHVQDRLLKTLDGIWGDVIFDNIFSDLRVRRKIEHNMRVLVEVYKDVQQALQWTTGWLQQRITPDLEQLKQRYAHVKSELDSHRRELMARAIAESTAKSESKGSGALTVEAVSFV